MANIPLYLICLLFVVEFAQPRQTANQESFDYQIYEYGDDDDDFDDVGEVKKRDLSPWTSIEDFDNGDDVYVEDADNYEDLSDVKRDIAHQTSIENNYGVSDDDYVDDADDYDDLSEVKRDAAHQTNIEDDYKVGDDDYVDDVDAYDGLSEVKRNIAHQTSIEDKYGVDDDVYVDDADDNDELSEVKRDVAPGTSIEDKYGVDDDVYVGDADDNDDIREVKRDVAHQTNIEDDYKVDDDDYVDDKYDDLSEVKRDVAPGTSIEDKYGVGDGYEDVDYEDIGEVKRDLAPQTSIEDDYAAGDDAVYDVDDDDDDDDEDEDDDDDDDDDETDDGFGDGNVEYKRDAEENNSDEEAGESQNVDDVAKRGAGENAPRPQLAGADRDNLLRLMSAVDVIRQQIDEMDLAQRTATQEPGTAETTEATPTAHQEHAQQGSSHDTPSHEESGNAAHAQVPQVPQVAPQAPPSHTAGPVKGATGKFGQHNKTKHATDDVGFERTLQRRQDQDLEPSTRLALATRDTSSKSTKGASTVHLCISEVFNGSDHVQPPDRKSDTSGATAAVTKEIQKTGAAAAAAAKETREVDNRLRELSVKVRKGLTALMDQLTDFSNIQRTDIRANGDKIFTLQSMLSNKLDAISASISDISNMAAAQANMTSLILKSMSRSGSRSRSRSGSRLSSSKMLTAPRHTQKPTVIVPSIRLASKLLPNSMLNGTRAAHKPTSRSTNDDRETGENADQPSLFDNDVAQDIQPRDTAKLKRTIINKIVKLKHNTNKSSKKASNRNQNTTSKTVGTTSKPTTSASSEASSSSSAFKTSPDANHLFHNDHSIVQKIKNKTRDVKHYNVTTKPILSNHSKHSEHTQDSLAERLLQEHLLRALGEKDRTRLTRDHHRLSSDNIATHGHRRMAIRKPKHSDEFDRLDHGFKRDTNGYKAIDVNADNNEITLANASNGRTTRGYKRIYADNSKATKAKTGHKRTVGDDQAVVNSGHVKYNHLKQSSDKKQYRKRSPLSQHRHKHLKSHKHGHRL